MPCSIEILDTYSRIRSRSILVNSSSAASNWSSTSSASSTTSSSSTSGIFLVLFDDIVQRHVHFLDLRSHFVPLLVASCVFKWRDEKNYGIWNCCLVCMSFFKRQRVIIWRICLRLPAFVKGRINYFCSPHFSFELVGMAASLFVFFFFLLFFLKGDIKDSLTTTCPTDHTAFGPFLCRTWTYFDVVHANLRDNCSPAKCAFYITWTQGPC